MIGKWQRKIHQFCVSGKHVGFVGQIKSFGNSFDFCPCLPDTVSQGGLAKGTSPLDRYAFSLLSPPHTTRWLPFLNLLLLQFSLFSLFRRFNYICLLVCTIFFLHSRLLSPSLLFRVYFVLYSSLSPLYPMYSYLPFPSPHPVLCAQSPSPFLRFLFSPSPHCSPLPCFLISPLFHLSLPFP